MSLAAPFDAGASANSAEADCSFIETQFPVSRLSKESYKERSAKNGQTLTGLGKWWGRKPLVMVRAVILGLLLPASNDPRKDRDVFLALLTMDEEGLWRRKRRAIPLKDVWCLLTQDERIEWFVPEPDLDRLRLRKSKRAERGRLQRIAFDRMTYDEKLVWCVRPEHIDGPSEEAWKAINAHLGTTAASLAELVQALGARRFGRTPRVGDAFCGGGSVPFEAARLGCEAFGSDINPVAALLTWGALNIVGGGEEVAERVRKAQAEVFAAVDHQVTEWRIEHNDAGWRADAFLYCTETACPACGWRVPLAPSWVVGEKPRAVARLRPEHGRRGFAIDIRSGVGQKELAAARDAGTVKDSRLECPNPACMADTPMTAIRGDRREDGGGDTACGCGRTTISSRGRMTCFRNGSTASAGARRVWMRCWRWNNTLAPRIRWPRPCRTGWTSTEPLRRWSICSTPPGDGQSRRCANVTGSRRIVRSKRRAGRSKPSVAAVTPRATVRRPRSGSVWRRRRSREGTRESRPSRNRFPERCTGWSTRPITNGRRIRSPCCVTGSRTGRRAGTSRVGQSRRAPRRMSRFGRADGRIGIICSRRGSSWCTV